MNKKSFISLLLILLAGLVVFYAYRPSSPPVVKTPKQVAFTELPGWDSSNHIQSFKAFQRSCAVFLRQAPDKETGSPPIPVKAGDWHPACKAAMAMQNVDKQRAKAFFETWFSPVELPVEGLFTGYYSPLLEGSLKRSAKYSIPLYATPDDLISVDLTPFAPDLKGKRIIGRVAHKTLVPYYTRHAIDNGAIKQSARVLLWLKDPIDRIFLEIQGSGMVKLDDGQRIYVGYAAQNGAPYTSIAKVLIDKGIMNRDNASMQRIRRYLTENPGEMNRVLHQNQSFVFFRILNQAEAFGSQGVALTPGYSLAVDRRFIPMGTPLWLNTTHPDMASEDEKPFQRLMIAQDTGGAIRGLVRGDVYWGSGRKATSIAGRMKNKGYYWLLLPHAVAGRIPETLAAS